MESPDYRNTLADILEFSGGKRMLTVDDVRQYTGLKDGRTIHRHFPCFKDGHIPATTLARMMCEGGKRK